MTGTAAAAVEAAPHVRVTWLNAISTRGRVDRCYADPADAARDAADRSLEPFNNTDVSVRWHAGHAQLAELNARREAHDGHVHVWSVPCRISQAISATAAALAAEVAAAEQAHLNLTGDSDG